MAAIGFAFEIPLLLLGLQAAGVINANNLPTTGATRW